jgi:NAD(P)H-hydrate epimerase
MQPVLTAAEMKDADRRTIEEIGLPGAVLMENAGAAVAKAIAERYPAARRPVVLCGKGNNGGDGFVVARRLLHLAPDTYLLGLRAEVKGDARLHMGVYERSGGALTEVADLAAWEGLRSRALSGDLVVDALLGTGLHHAPSGLLGRVVSDVAALQARGTPVVAVDMPSGIPSDTGELGWEAVTAALTVTFAAAKYGHVLPPSCEHVGSLVVADIGIPRSLLSAARLWLLEAADAAAAFPARAPGSHKGTYGHVLVVAGSPGKTGAAVLAASGALRAGAGLVTVATPAPALALVATGRAEVMTEALPVSPSGTLDREALPRALALAKERDAVVLGPGLGQEGRTRDFVRELVQRCGVPLVVDADGLNLLAPGPRGIDAATGLLRRETPTLVTPHPGEMARLVGGTTAEVQRRRLETARSFAMETGATVVLKGQRTIVADHEGRAAVNPTGNAGMATGGTGDVLAGILGALLARGLDPWTAATAGVYLHGLAGDHAAALRGQAGMTAGDLVEALPAAILALGPPRI